MTESFLFNAQKILVATETPQRGGRCAPTGTPPTPVNEPCPLSSLKVAGVSVPSAVEVLPIQSPAIEPSSLADRNELELTAAAALLDLALPRGWSFCVGSRTKTSGSQALQGREEIRVDISASELRRLLLENVKLPVAAPASEIVFNLVESQRDTSSARRAIAASRLGKAVDLWSAPPSPAQGGRKSGDKKTISKTGDDTKRLASYSLRSRNGVPRSRTALPATQRRGSFRKKPSVQSGPVPLLFSCSICHKRYANASNLSRHQQVHRSPSSSDAMTCDVCQKVYVSRSAFVMHTRTHTKAFDCTSCPKTFSRKWSLDVHVRSHTGEKPFACSLCNKLFSDRSNMHAHTFTHRQGTRMPCPLCHKVFWAVPYFKRHLKKVHHTTEASLSCRDDLNDNAAA